MFPYFFPLYLQGRLFKDLDSASGSVTPAMFTQALRTAFPQFDQRAPQGHHMQQDADECLNSILGAVEPHLKGTVEDTFQGQLTVT